MNYTPLISIAIPAYKSKYLGEAIESVLNQTLQNIELIIVNDASPNPITEVVEQYKDPRIRYFINNQNIGGKDPVANWNKCLSYANGTFFSLLCDDDVYDSNFLETLVRLANKYPDCSVFKSGVAIVNEKKEFIGAYPDSPEWESCQDYIVNVSKRQRKQTISEWLFRRKHIVSCGGYEPVPMAWGADYLSIMKFAMIGGIVGTTNKLAIFRRSGENISTVYDKNLEYKLLGTKVYIEKLYSLVCAGNDSNKKNLCLAIQEIRDFEYKASLSVASPQKIWRIRSQMTDFGIPTKMWVTALIKNIIKDLK